MNFELIKDSDNRVTEFVNELSHAEKWGGIVVYGAGYCGHELLSLIKPYTSRFDYIQVCDDFHKGEMLDEYDIVGIEDIKPTKDMRIYVTCGFKSGMIGKLRKLGLYKYYEEIDFGRYDSTKENYQYFCSKKKEIAQAYESLSDKKSKDLLVKIINYRISRNPEDISGTMEASPQYFPSEDYLHIKYAPNNEKHIFLDLGAYIGDTVKGFIEYTGGEYNKIIAVEALKKNYDRLVLNCKEYKDAHFINVGVSDRKGMVKFTTGEANNAFKNEEGNALVEVDSVDDILQGERVTFIKMDIEGAEYEAISGAVETIRKYVPCMAISVYHLVDDIFRLQNKIESICQGKYDYYLRHYSPTVIETVLYAVPKCEKIINEG